MFVKILFPFTMLSTVAFDTITIPFLILGLLQFPAYGIVLGLMNRRSAFLLGLIALAILHGSAAAAALALIGENFA